MDHLSAHDTLDLFHKVWLKGSSAATAVVAAAAAVGLTLALAKVAKRKRRTERESRRAQHRVAPMGKRGRWGGINSTAAGRETSSPEILSPLRRGGSEWT